MKEFTFPFWGVIKEVLTFEVHKPVGPIFVQDERESVAFPATSHQLK